jgi:hypothetical protein
MRKEMLRTLRWPSSSSRRSAVALRAAGRRPVATVGPPDLAEPGMVTPATSGDGPDSSVEQMQYVFHELHADGRHPLCAVCGSYLGDQRLFATCAPARRMTATRAATTAESRRLKSCA